MQITQDIIQILKFEFCKDYHYYYDSVEPNCGKYPPRSLKIERRNAQNRKFAFHSNIDLQAFVIEPNNDMSSQDMYHGSCKTFLAFAAHAQPTILRI